MQYQWSGKLFVPIVQQEQKPKSLLELNREARAAAGNPKIIKYVDRGKTRQIFICGDDVYFDFLTDHVIDECLLAPVDLEENWHKAEWVYT